MLTIRLFLFLFLFCCFVNFKVKYMHVAFKVYN